MHARLKPTPWDSHSIKTSEKSCYTDTLFQICFFNAAAGKTFTTVLAGLALTFISLPKMILTPALVAGFVRVLIRHRPGMANTPVVFNRAPLLIAFAFAPCFIDFMGGNMLSERRRNN